MADKPGEDKVLYERFLSIYNQLDSYMRKTLKSETYTDHSHLLQLMARTHRLFARYEHELKVFANLRNVLVHNPFMETANPIAVPNSAIVERYQQINKAILNPPTALSIAIPAAMIYTTTLDSPALPVMKLMNDKVYTHVPVIEKESMVGVFSENTILSYLTHNEDSIITSDLTIREFCDFIGFDKHTGEHFSFIGRDAMLADVYAMFNAAVKAHKRLGMLFITQHGKESEKLLGIITAWDLASPDFDT